MTYGTEHGLRGYTGHEHLDAFAVINMNGRVYYPITAQFFSPDPHIQAPGNWLNYNRYSYCLNNPLMYTDPSGEFIFTVLAAIFAPYLLPVATSLDRSWMQGGFSAKANGGNFWAGAGKGLLTGTMSAGLSMIGGGGFWGNLALGIGEGALTGVVGAALWGGDIGKGALYGAAGGAIFSTLTSDEFGNMMNGKGFSSNNKVLDNFRSGKYSVPEGSTWQQEALNYFGFEGTYDPKINNPGQFDPKNGVISYSEGAFNKNYDYLKAVYREEAFHKSDYLTYKNKATDKIFDLHSFEEWRAQVHMYKNQGLYPKSGLDWGERINIWGSGAGVDPDIIFRYNFDRPRWHFIYKIPRRW